MNWDLEGSKRGTESLEDKMIASFWYFICKRNYHWKMKGRMLDILNLSLEQKLCPKTRFRNQEQQLQPRVKESKAFLKNITVFDLGNSQERIGNCHAREKNSKLLFQQSERSCKLLSDCDQQKQTRDPEMQRARWGPVLWHLGSHW